MLARALTVNPVFSGSYDASDVEFLLKPLKLATIDVEEKERLIQSGTRHYSEMLSPEHAPGPAYMAAYERALAANAHRLALDLKTLTQALSLRPVSPKGHAVVSLARAGTPIGVLLVRELRRQGYPAIHYSISIVRGRGTDLNAVRHILQRHERTDLFFVDGWTGKGAIARELLSARGPRAVGVDPFLVVVADPAGQADLAATAEDYVIPSGILNGIVSGLVSRSVLNDEISEYDFHGCMVLDHLRPLDVSRAFIEAIDAKVKAVDALPPTSWSRKVRAARRLACETLVRRVSKFAGATDVNRIKPGIAEATRAVLRRVPDRMFVSDAADPSLIHLLELCRERGLAVERLSEMHGYRAVAVIKSLGSE
jgi:hypothetical protein